MNLNLSHRTRTRDAEVLAVVLRRAGAEISRADGVSRVVESAAGSVFSPGRSGRRAGFSPAPLQFLPGLEPGSRCRDYFTDEELRVMLGACAHARPVVGRCPVAEVQPVRNDLVESEDLHEHEHVLLHRTGDGAAVAVGIALALVISGMAWMAVSLL